MALPPADVQLDVSPAECGICYEAFRAACAERAPKRLWCCHSLCLACLRRLACRSGALSLVACPFCRTVTVVPREGLQGLPDDEALLQEGGPRRPGRAGPEEAPAAKRSSAGDSAWALDVDFNCRPVPSLLTVSSLVPAYPVRLQSGMGVWGLFHVEEVPGSVLVELPSRAASQHSRAPPSVENLRLCFAVTIILLIISIFFALVLFK
ncbi:hypothetical protein lerEdw1_015270 [Lerista edwardsae]|nr:hypothetical protein lerEdw1_015270 [Lerista edwardsae]